MKGGARGSLVCSLSLHKLFVPSLSPHSQSTSTTRTQNSTMSTASPIAPVRFMDLPPELRIEVYKLLVVVGKVFYTPDSYDLEEGQRLDDYEDFPAPLLTVLRVSKAVHEEAKDVYLSQNIFVLPSPFNSMPPFAQSSKRRSSRYRPLFSDRALAKVKHVSISLCIRARDAPLVASHSDWDDTAFEEMTPAERLERAHITAHQYAVSSRRSVCWSFEDLTDLQSAEIDFTNAYCPFGCCRFLHLGWKIIVDSTRKIRIIGLKSVKEKNEIMKAYQEAFDKSPEEVQQQHQIDVDLEDSWEPRLA